MATCWTNLRKVNTTEKEMNLDRLINEREAELDNLDSMIDQGIELEEILERTKVDTMTVLERLLDLGVLSMDIYG